MPTPPPLEIRPFLRPNLVTMLVTSVFSSDLIALGEQVTFGGVTQGPLDSLTRHPQFEAGYLWPKAVRQWHYVLPFGPRWWPKPCEMARWRVSVDGEVPNQEVMSEDFKPKGKKTVFSADLAYSSHHLRSFLLR